MSVEDNVETAVKNLMAVAYRRDKELQNRMSRRMIAAVNQPGATIESVFSADKYNYQQINSDLTGMPSSTWSNFLVACNELKQALITYGIK